MKNHHLMFMFRISLPIPPGVWVQPIKSESVGHGAVSNGFMIQLLWLGLSVYVCDQTLKSK